MLNEMEMEMKARGLDFVRYADDCIIMVGSKPAANRIMKSISKVSGTCGCGEDTSCYGCLRSFENQFYHEILERGIAHKYLSELLR